MTEATLLITHETSPSHGENDTVLSSALLLPHGHRSCPTLTQKTSQNSSCFFTSLSPQPPLSLALSCHPAHLPQGATNTRRSCQQLFSQPNPLKIWLSLAESRSAGKDRKGRQQEHRQDKKPIENNLYWYCSWYLLKADWHWCLLSLRSVSTAC